MVTEVKVNTKDCIGCGACVAICPDIFEFNTDSKSCVKKQPENSKEVECIEKAKEACPVDAIQINKVKN